MKKISKLFILAIAACMMFFFASCVKEYTITVQSNNDAYGTVTGSGTYAAGTQVALVALPAQGYYFNGWNDGNADNPRTITVNASATYIATFSDQPGTGGGGTGTGDAITLEGYMDANRTLPDRGLPIDYIIDGSLTLDGNACLTIEPGVTIAFTGVDGEIIVRENAGLKMVGTASNPITLRGPINNNNIGSWSKVVYESRRADNQMEYVTFLNGGSYDCVVSLNGDGKVSMKHCTIDGSTANGLDMWWGEGDKFYAFENNTIRNCTGYPLVINNVNAINQLGEGNVYVENRKNCIQITDYGINDGESITFGKQGIPYLFEDGMTVWDGGKMIVSAGVDIRFNANNRMYVSGMAYLQVNGTASDPVTIRGLEDEPGYWNGIEISSDRTNQGGNYLRYCTVSGSGAEDWVADIYFGEDARVALDHVTLDKSNAYGISLFVPYHWDEDAEDYVYDWNQLGITANAVTYSNCRNGNVYNRSSEQVFDGSQIPTAKKK